MSFNFFVILAACWLMIFDKQLCMGQATDEQSSPSPMVDQKAESETNDMAKSSEPIQQIPDEKSSPSPIVGQMVQMNNGQEVFDLFKASIQETNLPECLPVDKYHDLGPFGTYKLHLNVTTWADARRICREEGAHLAIINSKAEAKVLSTILSGMGYVPGASLQGAAFIGIHDLFKDGNWVTVLDDPLYATGYSDWPKHCCPPNPTENCGNLRTDDKLYALRCDCKLPFFCKKPQPYPCGKCC